VDDELARAVRCESALAIQYWWGVKSDTAWRWRKAFGVTIKNNPGSYRLIRAAMEAGHQALRERVWTAEERERQGERTRRLNLARHLQPGCHLHPAWTAEQVALLGTMPDEEVASQIGRSVRAVRLKREKMGIPNPTGMDVWKPAELALLGTLPDREVSRRTGRTLSATRQKRYQLKILAPGGTPR
jgi:hypothetical protein